MNAEGWKDAVLRAVANQGKPFFMNRPGGPDMLDVIAEYLAEVDAARRILRDKGYGVTGTPILDQVAEVPHR